MTDDVNERSGRQGSDRCRTNRNGVERTEMVVGRRYRVEWGDCCVSGSFTGTLTRKPDYDDGEWQFDVGTIESWRWTATEAGQ